MIKSMQHKNYTKSEHQFGERIIQLAILEWKERTDGLSQKDLTKRLIKLGQNSKMNKLN